MKIDSIKDQILNSYSDFLIKKKFEVTEELLDENNFGNSSATFSSQEFKIKFVKDRDQNTVDICSHFREDWADLNMIKLIINNDQDLTDNCDLKTLMQFLVDKYNNVSEILDEDHVETTHDTITEIRKKKLKQMFPKGFE
jgi:hypothetical protein